MDFTIDIPILPHYAGGYRLEYDGKYITLFGRDRRYKGFNFSGDSEDDWFEEMVLIPLVREIRGANPKIINITDAYIVVSLY